MKLTDRLPPTIVGLLVVASFAIGNVSGYVLRMNQEDVSAAKVIIEDANELMQIESETVEEQANVDKRKKEVQANTLDKCLTEPLPFKFSL